MLAFGQLVSAGIIDIPKAFGERKIRINPA
jgi:hypothetical protein